MFCLVAPGTAVAVVLRGVHAVAVGALLGFVGHLASVVLPLRVVVHPAPDLPHEPVVFGQLFLGSVIGRLIGGRRGGEQQDETDHDRQQERGGKGGQVACARRHDRLLQVHGPVGGHLRGNRVGVQPP